MQAELEADYPSDDDNVRPIARRQEESSQWNWNPQGRQDQPAVSDLQRSGGYGVTGSGYPGERPADQAGDSVPGYPTQPQSYRTLQNVHERSEMKPSRGRLKDASYDSEEASYGDYEGSVQNSSGAPFNQGRSVQSPAADNHPVTIAHIHSKTRVVPDTSGTLLQSHSPAVAERTHRHHHQDIRGNSDKQVCHKFEDLADLEYLDNDILLQHLQTRFQKLQPYTYVGGSLVAVNPCQHLDIYTQEFHDKYQDLKVRSSEPAHIFWVAAEVYRNLLTTDSHQCVVVSGDSGAGKTESTKFILQHLVHNKSACRARRSGDQKPLCPDIIQKLEQVNPLLELFGNASTRLNENSSRFGKLIELEYDDKGILTAAHLECFILEKFRVTNRNSKEKNFHVFYALFAGLSQERLNDLELDASMECYSVLKPFDSTDDVISSAEEWQKFKSQCSQLNSMLTQVGFAKEEISSLYEILSAILLISTVEFECPDDDVTTISPNGRTFLEKALSILGLDDEIENMETSLLNFHMEAVKGERLLRPKKHSQADEGRDALARELYSVLFYGIIDKINHNLNTTDKSSSSVENKSIRLLDISGFENMDGLNGFEQFIINSTNEKLHEYFLQHTLRRELQEYVDEGLPSVDAVFNDNSEVVQLIFAKPEGLIPLLGDEVAVTGSDRGWLQKCRGRSHPSSRLQVQPVGDSFSIWHYAGQVKYIAEGFVSKNKDTLPLNLREIVQQSKNTFIQDYFINGSEAAAARHMSGRASFRKSHSGPRRTPLTALTGQEGGSTQRTGKLSGRFTDQYQQSLTGMMRKLKTATPVFVRCIKPNLQLRAGAFDKEVVKDQLQSSGLLEVTKVRKDGYPIRIEFAHFVKRYKEILDVNDVAATSSRQQSDTILTVAGVTGHRMGHSKVFLKMHDRDKLEQVLDEKRNERERQLREQEEKEKQEAERAEKKHYEEATTTSQSTISDSGYSAYDRNSDPEIIVKTKVELPTDPKPEKKEGIGNQPAYNIFRLTERDFENSVDFEMKVRRCVRFILYLFTFLFILAGGVVSRLALVWLSSIELTCVSPIETVVISKISHGMGVLQPDLKVILEKDHDPKFFYRGLGPTRLLICLLIPLLFAWISCLIKILFGRKDWPNFKAVIIVAFIDCLSVGGRSLFVFKVLPNTELLVGVVLGAAVCQVPAILKLTSHLVVGPTSQGQLHTSRPVKHIIYLLLLLLAALVQVGALPGIYFSNSIISAISSSALSLRLPELWALIVAILCSSLGWWENYAYGRIEHKKKSESFCGTLPSLSKLRIDMLRIRQTSFAYTGPIQMVVVVALFFALNDVEIDVFDQIYVFFHSFGESFGDLKVLESHFSIYGLVYIQILGTFISAYLSGLACRLYMQRPAFASAVLLVTPTCMALSIGCTPANMAHWFDTPNTCISLNVQEAHVAFLVLLGVALWLSTVIINIHIWQPEVERTAKMERLFLFPYRDPVFPDINLQCRRRQDKQENAERKRRHKKSDRKSKEGVERPTVYICATMWHEVRQEMRQLLKSLFRIDLDIFTRKKAVEHFEIQEEHSDLYDPEIHIIFDDAFDIDPKSKQQVLNSWVRQFIDIMPEALGSVAKHNIDLKAPTKISTPYGGRLEWILPGGTAMFVHLKDKKRIRHRKRWSQILYLYYLLGFRLMSEYETIDQVLRENNSTRKRRRHRVKKNTSLLNNMPSEKVRQADNIFIMTLDGDVDFRPDSVRLLLDRMKKNRQVAAVCGRIHPIGDGPMVWYQQFEYSVGHWLQKAAEHVFGCVLCCPGCFSLFRGSALMDDNVMRMYTAEPTEATHFIQYEQGEDRWLCTLLLQQGWKIEYCAGADALTFAPETFHDFYIQRRRWSPSTMANIMDLISSWRTTVKMNDNISVMFMLYQFMLMASSVLAPGLVVYMIAGSYNAVLDIGLWQSYFLSVIPVFLYTLLCLKAKTETQINVAAIMSAVYAIIMLIVTVGTIINLATSDIASPDVLFLIAVAVIFVLAGILHPKELFCLFHGILYFITVPSTFVFLTVFFLCNLNEVSWGTREGPKKVDPIAQEQEGQQVVQQKGKLYKFFEKLGLDAIIQDVKTFVQQMMGIRREVSQQNNLANASQNSQNVYFNVNPQQPLPKPLPLPLPVEPLVEPTVELDHTYWTRQLDISNSKVKEIDPEEKKFWVFMIKEYLHPIEANKDREDKIFADLISIRNNVVFAYMILNLMFTLVLLQLKLQIDKLEDTFFIAGRYEPVSTVSLAVFAMLLITQFFGMLGHRWGTFLHLIASTKLRWFNSNDAEERAVAAIQEAQKLTAANAVGDVEMQMLQPPDYSDDDDTGDDYTSEQSIGPTPHTSSNDFTTLEEEPEEPPDYSDKEEDKETSFAGDAPVPVQYDSVFQERYKTMRKHFVRDNRPARAPMYQRQASGYRHSRQFGRRMSLYTTTRGAPATRKRGSIVNV